MISEENYPQTKYAAEGQLVSSRRPDVTLRQNIDGQIAQAETRLQELRDAKSRLEASAIIDMRIDDIQKAMRF